MRFFQENTSFLLDSALRMLYPVQCKQMKRIAFTCIRICLLVSLGLSESGAWCYLIWQFNINKHTIMASMINIGKELIRISPKDDRRLEFSNTEGRTWMTRIIFHAHFEELMEGNGELLAQTDKGLY